MSSIVLSRASESVAHNHYKSDIIDFSHTHSKSSITDFPTNMTPTAHKHNKSDITDFAHDHDVVTLQKNGFMSGSMLSKLQNIQDQANRTIVDNILSTTSTNPLQNRVIEEALRRIFVNKNITEADINKNPENFLPGYYHIDGGYCRMETGWPCNTWQAELLVFSTEINDGANGIGYKHLFCFTMGARLYHKMRQYTEWGVWNMIYTSNTLNLSNINTNSTNSVSSVKLLSSTPQSLSNGEVGLVV